MIGRDWLYTKSPEEIVIEQEERRPLQNSVQSALNKFPRRRDEAFSLYEQGNKKVEIADMMGVSRFVVGREIKEAERQIREQLAEDGINVGTPIST